jgi:SAM-dependent methyltransferase
MVNEWIWVLRNWLKRLRVRRSLRNLLVKLMAWQRFLSDYKKYQEMSPESYKLSLNDLHPCLGDDTSDTLIEPIYFYQDTWAFEQIIKNKPDTHLDVGSHHKFVAFLSKIVPVTMVDIRPLSLSLNNLNFLEGSLLALPFPDASIQSVSSLCVIEHIGLGRYGDPIDPHGSEKGIIELKRILATDGSLYVSLPVHDRNITYFNAHRAFSEDYILELFSPLSVVQSRYIYGNEFCNELRTGFGIACYHFRNNH